MLCPPDVLAHWAPILANFATIFGIIGIFFVARNYYRDRSKLRNERELQAYITSNSAYIDHLKICLEKPYLHSDGFDGVPRDQDHTDRDQDLLIELTVCMLENAYFLYRNHDSRFREKQWEGWNRYMKGWCKHPEFRKRWPESVQQYDVDFIAHITKIYDEASKELLLAKAAQLEGQPKNKEAI